MIHQPGGLFDREQSHKSWLYRIQNPDKISRKSLLNIILTYEKIQLSHAQNTEECGKIGSRKSQLW